MLASSTSPSPTLAGRSPSLRARGTCSPRTFASPSRPSQAKPRSSISVTTSAYAPASQKATPVTADAGTQYSPPDWPPTDPRSSRYNYPPFRQDHDTTTAIPHSSIPNGGIDHATGKSSPTTTPPNTSADTQTLRNTIKQSPNLKPPNEPNVRITPQSSLQATSTRRRSDEELSSAKRSRSNPATNRKVLPADYTKCEPKVLASLIATMLMRLIQHNDTIPLQDGQLTRFHSRAPPGISVTDYMARLTFHATLSPPILLSMVFFMDRLSEKFREFMINSLTVHRFLITAATVASKGLSDSFWTNQTYARVGGVSVKELALLELELLMKCGWQIVPKNDMLVEYYRGLIDGHDDYVIEGKDDAEEPDQAPAANAALTQEADDQMDTSGSNT